MTDIATKKLSQYVKRRGIKISAISAETGVGANAIYPSLSGARAMRADEFLAVCGYLGVDPMKFKKDSADPTNPANQTA